MPLIELNGTDYANLMVALDTRKQRIEKMMEIYADHPQLLASYEGEMQWAENMKSRVTHAVFPSLFPDAVNQTEKI